jgi:hypothetical protein
MYDLASTARFGSRFAIGIVAVLCAVFVADGVHADGEPGRELADSALVDAVRVGLGREAPVQALEQLTVTRFGHSLVLEAQSPRGSLRIECALCTSSEMLSAARSFGALVTADRSGSAPAYLSVRALGRQDRIFVDGVPVAPAHGPSPIEPGDHVIVLERGDEVATRAVTLESDVEALLDADEALAVKRTHRRLKVLLGGLGATAAALGGVFLWLDGRCATASVDLSGQCAQQHNLAPAGWTLLSAGILAEVALLIWVFWPEDNQTVVEEVRP